MYIIYKRTCPEGKVYIGCTRKTLEERAGVDGMGYKDSTRFFNAILKFGWSLIKTEVLATVDSASVAAELELEYIIKYKATDGNYGYNTEKKGYTMNEVGLGRLRSSLRIALAKPEVKKRHIEGLKQSMNKPEVIQRLRDSANKQWSDSEFRKRHAESTRIAVNRPEVKAKVAAHSKAGWADVEYRARRLKQMQEPEYKVKMRASQAGFHTLNNGILNKRVKEPEYSKLMATGDWSPGYIKKTK